MKKKLLAALLMLVASVSIAFAQNDKAAQSDLNAKVPVDKKVVIGHLDNGLTYYIRVNKKPENRVQFRLVTNAGSILEDEAQRGLAHFCEHMAFNGTEYFPHNTMISTLQKNGIEFGREINAYTSFDETVYYVNLPADDPEMMEMGFKILDGWASKLTFDPQELEDERGVIHEEWRGGLGAEDRLRAKTWPIMLNGSKYAERLPIGLESVIMGFKRDDIVRFYQDWYRPDLQAVIIVGDVNVKQVEAKIKEYFSDNTNPANEKARVNFDIPENVEPLIAIATDKEATSTNLQMFWKHEKAPNGTIGNYRESIVRQLINGMINSRFADLCEKSTAPMIAAMGGYGGFLGRNGDAFELYAYPKEGRVNEAAELLLAEMTRIDQHGFLQTELDRQKEDVLDGYRKLAKEVNKTNSNNFADEYTRNFLEGECIPGIRQEFAYAQEFLDGITLEEVNAMVKSWITDENFVFYLTAPDKPGYVIPTEAEVKTIIANNKTLVTEPWVDNFKDEPLFDRNLPAASYTKTKTNDVLGYTEYTLSNGIRFIVKKTNYKDDEILMQSFSNGGISLYGDDEVFTATLTASLIDAAGIGQFSATQLSKKLKGKTLGINPRIDGMSEGFTGSCSPKDLETLLQLLVLYYDAPRKDKESFDKEIESLATQYKMVLENPQIVLMKKFYETAYCNSKRLIIAPTVEQINSVDLDRVYQIYKERFNDASDQTFFFVGNIEDQDIDLIAKYIAALPCNGKQKGETWNDVSPVFASGVNHEEVRKGTDNQGMIMIMGETEGFSRDTRSRITCSLLSDALSITALEVIREKMGGTYSPYVSADYEILPKPEFTWLFFINCDPDNAAKVEKAAIDIMKQYTKKGVDKETLAKVKEQMVMNRETAMQNNSFWLGQIYGSYFYNESRDETVRDYNQIVNSITAKDVKAMAKKYIDFGRYTVVTLKPEN